MMDSERRLQVKQLLDTIALLESAEDFRCRLEVRVNVESPASLVVIWVGECFVEEIRKRLNMMSEILIPSSRGAMSVE